MNKALKVIIMFLINKHYIGGKHFPEHKLIVSKTKYLRPNELKQFKLEYKHFRNEFLICLKKRTGKNDSIHISLNPRKLKNIFELIENE